MLIKPLFQKGPSIAARVFLVCAIASALLILDHYFKLLEPLKSSLMKISTPIYKTANLPNAVFSWNSNRLTSREDLLMENGRLESENLLLRGKLQKLSALTIENLRLRELLNATNRLGENVLAAEVVSISPEPSFQFVILNKGSKQGAYVGQAVIDGNGLLGQIMSVSESLSRVLLISDQRHAVPVQINRNGKRLIAEGSNSFTELNLPHVALTTDIVVGDVLSTSGLGGLFPIGYPVATVSAIEHDEGQAFAIVKATPFAQLDRTRHVLLLFPSKP